MTRGWYVRKADEWEGGEWVWAVRLIEIGEERIAWERRPARATCFKDRPVADAVALLMRGEVVADTEAFDPNDRAYIVRWLRRQAADAFLKMGPADGREAEDIQLLKTILTEAADGIERGQHWEDSR